MNLGLCQLNCDHCGHYSQRKRQIKLQSEQLKHLY